MTGQYELYRGDDYVEISTPDGILFQARYCDDGTEARAMVEKLNASDEHQGHANYETWAADVHVNQEQEVQARWLDLAATLARDEDLRGPHRPGSAVNRLTCAMIQHYVEIWDYVLGTTNRTLERDRNMIRDVGSIDRVDWREVAARLLAHSADIEEHERKRAEAGR